jgi:hypothetical protein
LSLWMIRERGGGWKRPERQRTRRYAE